MSWYCFLIQPSFYIKQLSIKSWGLKSISTYSGSKRSSSWEHKTALQYSYQPTYWAIWFAHKLLRLVGIVDIWPYGGAREKVMSCPWKGFAFWGVWMCSVNHMVMCLLKMLLMITLAKWPGGHTKFRFNPLGNMKISYQSGPCLLRFLALNQSVGGTDTLTNQKRHP